MQIWPTNAQVFRSALLPFAILCLFTFCLPLRAQDTRVLAAGQALRDHRLQPPKDLNGYFPFAVPESAAAWQTRATFLRKRVLVANGLWPMPPRTPLEPVIHGLVERPGFTVEKVYFQSLPNHFVTGLLFRPSDDSTSKRPAVLCPHGHGGRMQDYGANNMEQLIASGAEQFEASGRFPKIARCAQLAKMGCVVFIFDMLGYEDSQQISYQLAHRFAKQREEFTSSEDWGFFSAQAEMRLQSIMGLQTWNAIRSLDFLASLPDVDAKRLGVTGGSGGGTQTILLCAIDDRPVVAFPNGMVSTAMQGGCTCENCSLLRVDSGNVELAALFAPKPQAMTAANDWTKAMMTKGYPELQKLYALLGKPEHVYCREMLNFPHNYNMVSRETMYTWFNRYLGLEAESLEETDYEPLSAEEAAVWNEQHPAPSSGDEHEREVIRYMTEVAEQQLFGGLKDGTTTWPETRENLLEAMRCIVGRQLETVGKIERTKVAKETLGNNWFFKDLLNVTDHGEQLPVISLYPKQRAWNGKVVLWISGTGKQSILRDSGEITQEIQSLLDSGSAVVAVDLCMQGEFLQDSSPPERQPIVENPREAPAYTYCYNDTLLVRRVHDILTLVEFIRSDEHAPSNIQLVGVDGASPLVAVAGALADDAVSSIAIEDARFRFASIEDYRDPNLLPGAIKYGDLPGILALCAPRKLLLGGTDTVPALVKTAYREGSSNASVATASGKQEFFSALTANE